MSKTWKVWSPSWGAAALLRAALLLAFLILMPARVPSALSSMPFLQRHLVCLIRADLLSPFLPPLGLMGFPHSSAGKESACNARDLGWIPGLGRSPGEGKRLHTPVFWPDRRVGHDWATFNFTFPFPGTDLSWIRTRNPGLAGQTVQRDPIPAFSQLLQLRLSFWFPCRLASL